MSGLGGGVPFWHALGRPLRRQWRWLGAACVLFAACGDALAADVAPRRLLEVVDFGAPVMSPDGSRVAFRVEQASVERNTYDTTWYVQSMEGGPPRRVADGGVPLRDSAGNPVPPDVTWSPDGRWIYYRALLDGRIDVWRAAADGAGSQALTHDPADVRAFVLGEDGSTLTYSVGATREEVADAEQREYDVGIRVDGSVPVGQPLFRSGLLEGRPATQRYGGVWFDRGGLLAGVPDRWKVLDLRDPDAGLVPSKAPSAPRMVEDVAGGEGVPTLVAEERDGARIAVVRRMAVGAALSMRPRPDASREVICQAELCTGKAITSVQWRPGSDEILFTVTDPLEGLAQSIFAWNVVSDEVREVVAARGLVSGGRDSRSQCAASTEALACVTSEADVPPRLERIDLETGARRVLFAPNLALAQDIAERTPATLLRWTDAQGDEFTGQLFAAPRREGRPPPLFIAYYTCPGFLRGGMGDEWPLASLAANGISALCINQHHERLPDRVALYAQTLGAVEAVIDLLAAQSAIDPERIGMGGLSLGSAITLWAAMHSDRISAVSVASPVVSYNYYLMGSLKGEAFTAGLRGIWQLGAPDETPGRWAQLSPALNIDRIRAPVLMQIPEQEYLYALDYTIPLLRAQRADLYVFPNEPHQKFQPRHKLAVYERNLDWFRFWLLDVEDDAPGKATQYAIWRGMREARAQAQVALHSTDR
ncbi:MAG: Atxe2 family lasso peptide isopeptidase [Luteimonas sp.]